MRFKHLFIVTILIGSPLLLFAQQKKKPDAPNKPSVSKPKLSAAVLQEQEAYAYLLVNSDLDVTITLNYGKTYRVLCSEGGRRIPLELGDNLLEIKPLDGGSDGYAETITIDKKGNRVYSVKLKAGRVADHRTIIGKASDPFKGGFILVKGGNFEMGCTSEQRDCGSDQRPKHLVTLRDYYLGETEVTEAQWRSVMGTNLPRNTGCDQCPVTMVSWEDIQDFLRKLNHRSAGVEYRLPTEAEWEYAARGGREGNGHVYSGSTNLEDVGWFANNSGGRIHPVAEKRPNELGIYDLSGNAWEWCSDWYGAYSSSAQTNPVGAPSGAFRVFRGGSCNGYSTFCRVIYRNKYTSDSRFNNLGFRLARTY